MRRRKNSQVQKTFVTVALLDRPLEDEIEAHLALLNWAAWCVVRRRPGRCASVEGRFVPPKQNIYNPPEPKVAVDVVLAEKVNSALLEIPFGYRDVLRLRYHERKNDRTIAQEVGVHVLSYQRFIRDARLSLLLVLLRPDNGVRSTATIRALRATV